MAPAENRYFIDQSGIARIVALSDGVFSIVITLIIFDIKLPADTDARNLGRKLVELYPTFLSFVATFLVIGVYWIGHHAIFRHIRRYDRSFLWLNLLFLLFVAFLPFPTTILGRYGATSPGITLYGLTLVAIGCSLAALWRYATKDLRLVDSTVTERLVRMAYRRILFAPALALVSIGISFFSPTASLYLFVLAAIYYCLPTGLDKEHLAARPGAE